MVWRATCRGPSTVSSVRFSTPLKPLQKPEITQRAPDVSVCVCVAGYTSPVPGSRWTQVKGDGMLFILSVKLVQPIIRSLCWKELPSTDVNG